MAIGRPISLTPNIATKNISSLATADQTEFTVTGGYRINEIAVYRNGVRLAEGRDFTASDGDTVTLVTAASTSDVIEFSVFDSFNVSDAIVSAASSQNLNGDFNVTGKLYAGTFEPGELVAGVSTSSVALHVGTALTANAAGDVQTVGIITAASFSGSGANLTGVASTDNIITGTAATFRDTAVNAGVPNVNIVGLATVGIITAYGTAEITGILTTSADAYVGDALDVSKDIFVGAAATITGATTIGGAVNIDATTDSTSSTSGALIVDGGLGVAKNVYIGAGLSVAGTLTYEDVTSVDSVGMVTAKSGVNITGGELTVGSGITMGIAGVATFSGTSDVHLLDNVKLIVGDGSDFTISHNGSNTMLEDSGTGNVVLRTNYFDVTNAGGSEDIAKFESDGPVSLYHNAIKTFTTVGTGISIYGPEGGNGQVLISADEGDDNADKFNLLVNTSGSFFLQNYASGSWANNLRAYGGGSVELMYGDGTKKWETTNDGAVTTGIATATLGIDAAISVWTLGASGTDHYTFTGPGNLSATSDPTLNLIRGQKYTFKNRSGGHPFRIQSTANGSAGTAYNTGVTNNDGGDGTNILFDVPHDAPSILYYQCTSHGNMGGAMYISGSAYETKIGSSITLGTAGVVTATKYIGDGSALTGVGGDTDITSCLFV